MTTEATNQPFKRPWERDFLADRKTFPNPATPATGAEGDAASRDRKLEFGFEFERIHFIAHLYMEGEDAHIRLWGDLGPLPYSAASREARSRLRRILAEVATVPRLGLRLSKRRHVMLQGSEELGRPPPSCP